MTHILKPHPLLDAVKQEFNLKTDAALHRFLEIDAPHVSKLRNGTTKLGAETILRIYDKTGWSINKIRSYLEVPNE